MAITILKGFTIADGVRIFFQRLWWIVACFALVGAVLFAKAYLDVSPWYRVTLDIMVAPGNSDAVEVRAAYDSSNQHRIVSNLVDNVVSDTNLERIARNLRLAQKNAYIREEYPRLDRSYDKSNPEEVAELIPEAQDQRRELLETMELVTLARFVGYFPLPSLSDEKVEQKYGLDAQNSGFITYLGAQTDLGNKATVMEVRRQMVQLGMMLLNSPKPLKDVISVEQSWILEREILARRHLTYLGLHYAATETARGFSQRRNWADIVRGGLSATLGGQGNVIFLTFEYSDPATARMVMNVCHDLLAVKYASLEESNRSLLQQTLQEKILNSEQEEAIRQGEIRTRLAQMGLQQTPLHKVTDSLRSNLSALQNDHTAVSRELENSKNRLDELSRKLADPDLLIIKTPHAITKPTPAAEELLWEKTLKEKELESLLKKSTEQHPFVRSLRRKIALLEEKIAAAGVITTTEYDVAPNPEAEEWRKEKTTLNSSVTALQLKADALAKRIKTQQQRIEDAPGTVARLSVLEEEIVHLRERRRTGQQALVSITAQQRWQGRPLWADLTIHRQLESEALHTMPPMESVLISVIMAGLLCSLVVVSLVEYTDHSIKGVEGARRLFDIPVLGAVPEYELSDNDDPLTLIYNRILRLLNKNEPLNNSRNEIIEHGQVSSRRILLALVVLIALLAIIGYFTNVTALKDMLQRASIWIESPFEGWKEENRKSPADALEQSAPLAVDKDTDLQQENNKADEKELNPEDTGTINNQRSDSEKAGEQKND